MHGDNIIGAMECGHRRTKIHAGGVFCGRGSHGLLVSTRRQENASAVPRSKRKEKKNIRARVCVQREGTRRIRGERRKKSSFIRFFYLQIGFWREESAAQIPIKDPSSILPSPVSPGARNWARMHLRTSLFLTAAILASQCWMAILLFAPQAWSGSPGMPPSLHEKHCLILRYIRTPVS